MNFSFSKLCKQDWSDRLNAIDLVTHLFATDLAFKIECNCYLLWLYESSGLQDFLLLLHLAAVLLQAHLFRVTKETFSSTTCDCQRISREHVITSDRGYKGILKIPLKILLHFYLSSHWICEKGFRTGSSGSRLITWLSGCRVSEARRNV